MLPNDKPDTPNNNYPNPKQPSCKKCVGQCSPQVEKRCGIQSGSQEMAVMVG